MEPAEGEVVVGRHQPDLPRFVVLPFDPKALWGKTALFTADGHLGGVAFHRRSVLPWGDGVRWFMGVTEPMCREGGFDTGDRVRLVLQPASDAPPPEIAERLASDPGLAIAWSGFSDIHRREWCRWVEGAKKAETRQRRADEVARQVKAKAK